MFPGKYFYFFVRGRSIAQKNHSNGKYSHTHFLRHFLFSKVSGLQRAIARNAEKLNERRLLLDYYIYYYAAQRLHFERDDPKKAADIIFNNN